MARTTTMRGVLALERVKDGKKKGQWYWNLTVKLFGKDIQLISSWPESYHKRTDCIKNAETTLMNKWVIDDEN